MGNLRENNKLLKKIKPKKSVLICYTLIFLGPLMNLIFDLIIHETKYLGITIFFTIISIPFIFYYWHDFRRKKMLYEDIKEQLRNNPEGL